MQKEYCLSSGQQIDCTSDVINVLEENRPELVQCPVMKDQ